MPQASNTRRVRDTYTNKVYDIPWKDTTRDPDEDEIEELINARKRASAPPPEPTLFERATSPLVKWASPTAHYLSNKLTSAGLNQLDDHTYDKDSMLGKIETWNREKIVNPGLGFMGGSLEGVGDLLDDLTNPVDATATLLSAGSSKAVTAGVKGYRSAIRGLKGAEEIAAAAKYANKARLAAKASNALTASRGAYNVADALGGDDEGNIEWHKLGAGALEAALSGHGFSTANKAGRIAETTEGRYGRDTRAAAEQALADEEAAKVIRRGRLQDTLEQPSTRLDLDNGPVRRAEHANPVWARPEPRQLGTGRVFHGYGDVIGDATGRDPLAVQREVLAEADRLGIGEDNAGRIIPRRSAPNTDWATRNPLEPVPQVDPSGSSFSSSLPSRPARRDLFTRTGSTLPDIDITPLRSEVVPAAVEAAPVAKGKGKRGRKAKAKVVKEPYQESIMTDVEEENARRHFDDRDGDRADAEAEARAEREENAQGPPDPGMARPQPPLVNSYENMPEPVLKILADKGNKQAIEVLAKRRSGSLGDMEPMAPEPPPNLADKVTSRLGDFVQGDTPRGLGARISSAAREPKSPHAPTIKKDPDFSYNGEHNVTMPNGEQTKIFYDRDSQTWYHTGDKADLNTGPHSSHHSTEWAFSKQELLDKLHEKLDPDSFAAKNAVSESSGDADPVAPAPPPTRQVGRREAAAMQAAANPSVRNVNPVAANGVAPKVKPTTRAEVLAGKPNSLDTRSTFSKAVDPFTKSGLTTLEEMGPAGEKISRTYKYLRAEANHEAGKRISELGEASKNFNMDERTNLFDVLDGTAKPMSPKVADAAKIGRRILDETGIEAEKLNMQLKLPSGKKIPFTRHQGPYAPHVFDDAFFEGQNKQTLYDTLLKEGRSPDEAKHILEAIKNYGDRLIDPQHTRSLNLKGYRRDPEAINKYLGDMWQKIGEARHLGVEDLADAASPISKLVADTTNPQLAHKILNDQLGRTIHDAGLEKVVHNINSAQVAMKLPLFAISNLSQRATPLLRSSLGDYTKAISSVLTDKTGARARAEVSGSLQAVNKQLFQDSGGESRISRIYNMRRSETGNRVFTSEVGRNAAERLFSDLKKNPNNKLARKQLDDLLLEDVDTVLKQNSLTDKQKSISSYRMNELTQGITDNIDLPPLWNGHPAVKLLTLFRKFAFVQTKIIKEAIKENPTRNIPLALFAYAAAGEGIGDTKTAISSFLAGKDTKEEIKKRGQYKEIGKITERILNSEKSGAIVGRLAQNLADGFAFGLLDDAMTSSLGGKPTGWTEFLGGVNIGDVSRIGGGVGRSIQGIGKSVKDTVEPTAKELVRTLPFGRSLAHRFFDEEE